MYHEDTIIRPLPFRLHKQKVVIISTVHGPVFNGNSSCNHVGAKVLMFPGKNEYWRPSRPLQHSYYEKNESTWYLSCTYSHRAQCMATQTTNLPNHGPLAVQPVARRLLVPSDIVNMDATRAGRMCRKRRTVPSRDDLIQVLWILDNVSSAVRAEWCMADVLYVERLQEGDVLGRGYIRYPEVNGLYEEQFDHVEFLPDNLLRCAKSDSFESSGEGECEQHEERNNIPKMSWRFSLSTGNRGESESDDESWHEKSVLGPNRKRKAGHESYSGSTTLGQDVLELRKRYTYVQIELERVKREMAEVSKKVQRIEEPTSGVLDREVQRVLSRLRSRIVLKFQTPVRNLTTTKARSCDVQLSETAVHGAMDGIQKGSWRIRVECDLDQFECFARIVQTNQEMEKRVRFFPEYCHTQCPSRSSTEYRIVLPTFFDLCAIMNIGSFSDRLEMMRKCCSTQQGTVVRLVGSYVYDGKSKTGPCYINVGSSGVFCPDCYSSLHHEEAQANGVYDSSNVVVNRVCGQGMKDSIPILVRTSRAWDLVDGRFLSPLRVQHGNACLGMDPRDIPDAESGVHLFQIVWRRAADLSSRIWSTELATNCAIHGVLEVVIPYIQLYGQVLCAEFAGVATEDVLSSVVSNSGTK